VLGIDISPAMVELARANAPGGRFLTGSFLGAELPPCAAVTAIGEVLNYAFDDRNGEAELGALFARAHAALVPGGMLAFDLLEPGQTAPGQVRQGWSSGPDWAVLFEVEERPAEGLLERRITSFRQQGDLHRRTQETHRQRLFGRSRVLEALAAAGFRARAVRGFGDLRFGRAHAGFLAFKRRRP